MSQAKKKTTNKISGAIQTIVDDTSNLKGNVTKKAKNVVSKSYDQVVQVIDQNGDGKVDIEDIIILGLKTPGIKINRSDFLHKEFNKHYPKEVIEIAVAYNPLKANISSEVIDKICDSVIQFERNCVSGVAAALGAPGGFAMAATIPADLVQYYGYLLRATQKILYLYGFPEIDTSEDGKGFDAETLNVLILCMGVMYGTAGANKALKGMAHALGKGVEKKLLRTALTKTTFYPIVKNTLKWFNISLTKTIYASFFKKAIPIVGGVIGGGITYVTFKTCCIRLQNVVQDTILSNPDYNETEDEIIKIDLNQI